MNRTFVTISVFLLVLVLGLVASASGKSDWVSLNGQISPAKPQAEVLSSNGSETIVKFTIPGFWSAEVMEDNTTYRVLEFPGYASTLEPGKPQLPVISELIAIPGNTNVTVQVLDFTEEVFSGYTVYPFQTPLKENENRVKFEIDRGQYTSNSLYPEQHVSVGAPAIWRDLRVANLRVSPLRYNAVTKELIVCTEITVKLDYSGISNVNVKAPLKQGVAPNYDRMYRNLVLNYEYLGLETQETERFTAETDNGYDYLIIAADNYVANMTPFINWKNILGFSTQIVPASQVGTKFSDIKAYISNEYFTNGIKYVLLVGNEVNIPGDKQMGIFSDYSYTLLEGDDYYAEIAIGRFAADNATHVDNMVNKSVTFEANPPAGDWLNKSLLIANWEEAPGKYQYCKEEIRTAAQTSGGFYAIFEPTFTTCYGASFENGGDEASNADVVDYFNEGFRLVNYRGHGDTEIWWNWNVYGEHFDLTDVAALDNGQMTPVVFSIACLNADLSYEGTTIAEAFTHTDDGAVAYLGASEPSYTTPNHDYDKELYKCVFDEGINAIADASNEASVRVIDLWGSYGIQNARMYLWLGDPTLQLVYGTELPLPPPELVSPDDCVSFDEPAQPLLVIEEVAGAVAYQYQLDDNDDFYSPIMDESGIEETSCSTPQLGAGMYYWRVRATDGVRNSDWSEVRVFSVGMPAQAPELMSPANGSTLLTADLLLKWYEVLGASEYDIEIDNDSDFSSPVRSATSDLCSGGICQWQVFPALKGGTYYWRVRVGEDGWPWSEVWWFKVRGKNTAITFDGTIPDELDLLPNYPNPFNPSTEISFGLPKAGHVTLEVFNITGQRVSKLVDADLSAGYHSYTFDGSCVASGLYLYRLATEEQVVTRRMLLVK